jgi:hypothetical protein
MGVKHKKTRKEKVIADYRHQVYILKNKDVPLNNSTPIVAVATNNNLYSSAQVLRDITKTGILTCSIIAGQIILFFLLMKHIIILPIVKY